MGTPEARTATVSAQVASVTRSMDMILPNDGLKPPVVDLPARHDCGSGNINHRDRPRVTEL